MKHYTKLSEMHADNHFPPPESPLFSIYRCTNNCSMGDREFTSDFYMIAMKKLKSGVILYGRTRFDHESGSMMFVKPRQVIEMKNLELDEDGFLVFIHEDFLNGHVLHDEIKKYRFFDYEINEALHLSPKEEKTIWQFYQKIEGEYSGNQDEYSREIILAVVETILKYAQRFYKRQFINRLELSGKTVTRFNEEIDRFMKEDLALKGMPTVAYMAERLNVSPGYLTDLLKQETGKTALEHIHIYLVSEAKHQLKGNDQSVSEIAYELGFENLSYFSRLFKKETGVSPLQFRKQLMN